ncbi:MAG: tetratricopeptide repeat protein [Thermoplasmatota archaeon]
MSSADLHALIMIIESEGLPVNGLAEKMGVTDRHSSRVAVTLEKAGLIRKTRHGKEILLYPMEGSRIISAMKELITDDRGRGALNGILEDHRNTMMILSLLTCGPGGVEDIINSLTFSRSTFYRTLKRIGPDGMKLVVLKGRKEKMYSLNTSDNLPGRIAGLARMLYPDLEYLRSDHMKREKLTTLRTRILVYLENYSNIRDRYVLPMDLTQEGMAESLWTTQPIISKELLRLKDQGLISEKRSHISNQKRKKKTYHLTDEGDLENSKLIPAVRSETVNIVDFNGVSDEMKIGDIPGEFNTPVSIVEILNYLVNEDILVFSRLQNTLESRRESRFISSLHRFPVVRYFFGRSSERMSFLQFLEDDGARLMKLSGEAGIGKTTFLSRITQELKQEWPLFYYSIDEWSTPRGILTNLALFLERWGRDELKNFLENRRDINLDEAVMVIERSLNDRKVLLIFDDVQNGDERIEKLYQALLGNKILHNLKIVLSGRIIPQISSYKDRHYDLAFEGLDRESSTQLLAERNVDRRTFEKIFHATRGHPLALELIGSSGSYADFDMNELIRRRILPGLNPVQIHVLEYSSVFRYPITPDAVRMIMKRGGLEYPHRLNRDDDTRERADEAILEGFVKLCLMTYSGNSYRLHDIFKTELSSSMGSNERNRYHIIASDYYRKMQNDPARVEVLYHLTHGGYYEDAVEFLRKYGDALIKRGYCENLKEILERIDPNWISGRSRICFLFYLGEIHFILGNWKEAVRNYNRSISICRSEGFESLITRAKVKLAMIHDLSGEQQEAIREYGESIELARKFEQSILESYAVRHLGTIAYIRGDVETAESYYEASMKIARDTRSRECLANAYFLGSMLCQLKKDYGKCETQMRASLRIYDELGDNNQKLKTMNNLAWLYAILEDWEKSMDLLEKMISLSSSIGDFLNKGFGLLNSADILIRKGEFEEAERRLNRAYHHFVLLNEVRMIHSTEHTFAMLYKRKGSLEKARFFFDRASEGYAKNEIINQFPELLYEYGDMEDSVGSRTKAEGLYREGLMYANKMKDEMWIEKINGRLRQ